MAPSSNDPVEAKVTFCVQTVTNAARANVAYEIKLLAKCVAYSLRRNVVLEHLYYQINELLASHILNPYTQLPFTSFPLDLDESAADDDFDSEKENYKAA